MRKIGILGGTFNPPHIGHLIIANEVKDALGLDEVRFMPNAIAPHKQAAGDASSEQRLEMVALSICEYEGFSVEPYEVQHGGVSYTYETMKYMVDREPEHAFYFIIGGDMIDYLPKWYNINELLSLITFVGVKRPGSHGHTTFPVRMVDIPQIDLSSTLIRNRLSEGKTVRFLLPEKVEEYIRKEGLYGICRN